MSIAHCHKLTKSPISLICQSSWPAHLGRTFMMELGAQEMEAVPSKNITNSHSYLKFSDCFQALIFLSLLELQNDGFYQVCPVVKCFFENLLTTSFRLSQKSHPYFSFRHGNISYEVCTSCDLGWRGGGMFVLLSLFIIPNNLWNHFSWPKGYPTGF